MAMGPPFAVGASVLSRSKNRSGVVLGAKGTGPELWYEVFFDSRDPHVRLPASDLVAHHASPLDTLLGGDWVSPREFDLMTLGLSLQVAHAEDRRASLSTSRLEPQPHQVFVVYKAVSALYPRLLLADEVGLGKTIEAGMIMKELKARDLAARTLIVVPASLVSQWVYEMQSKFNERFIKYDSQMVSLLRQEDPGRNVWRTHNQVIASLQFARDESRVLEIAAAGWDLVIIDEAHHARRSREAAGKDHARKGYGLAAKLAEQSKSLLLLTATPLQLQEYEFYSLLALLDPAVFPTYEAFQQNATIRQRANRLAGRVEVFHTLPQADQENVAQEFSDRLGDGRTPEELSRSLASESGRRDAVDRLSDSDVLAGLMVRNRKRVVGGFTQRRVTTVSVDITAEERDVYDEMWRYIRRGYHRSVEADDRTLGFLMITFQKLLTSSPYALERALERRIGRLLSEPEEAAAGTIREELEDEAEGLTSDVELDDQFEMVAGRRVGDVTDDIAALRKLLTMVRGLKVDSKLAHLRDTLKAVLKDKGQKVLIFTQFKMTLDYLRSQLEPDYKVAVFHGSLDSDQKDAAALAFRDQAQIMISTEAGGEGRNFQFCNCLVNYDLPWNPMKVEQRIGRLDRIGQKRDVFVYSFALTDTIESRVLEVLRERIKLFEDHVGMLDPIVGTIEHGLLRILMEAPDPATSIHLVEVALEDKVRRAQEAESRMQDFLMDRASFRRDTSAEILGLRPSYGSEDIERFLDLYFSRFPAQCLKRNPDATLEIAAPEVWAEKHRSAYERSPYRGTCEPARAAADEGLAFFAFGHPVFDAAMVDVSTTLSGAVTSRICVGTSRPGLRLLQAVVHYEFSGVRAFRRATTISIDIDTEENDPAFSEELSHTISRPASGPKIGEADVPRIRRAWTLIDEVSRTTCGELLAEIAPENRRLYDRERKRLERQYDHRATEAGAQLDEARANLERIDASGTDGDRRILPVFRKRVEDYEQAVRKVVEERKARLADLESRQKSIPSITVRGLCLVMTV